MASISLNIFRLSGSETVATVKQAEQYGIKACWIPTQPFNFDAVPVMAVAGAQTTDMIVGTGITPTYPRHPVALATEAMAITEMTGGRFRLGVGPSHAPIIETALGIPFGKPASHLREYVTILRSYLQEGKAHFDGKYYNVHAELPVWAQPSKTPVYLSANRPNAFKLAGELADGVMSSWEPIAYLREVALPTLKQAAESAGRPRPHMISHIPIITTEDPDRAFQIATDAWAQFYKPLHKPYSTTYGMVGLSLLEDGSMSPEVFKEVFVYGSEAQIRQRFYDMLSIDGIDEVMVTVHTADNPAEEEERVLKILGSLEEEFSKR
jgi:Coenzyme F420-dependent N5,N10-methylene tetrahydromethanopterin reductase and related flavin-dependent oxidoreductases